MNRTIRTAALIAAAGAALAGPAIATAAITGSGATFPRIAYENWCRSGGNCSYTGKGSTGGIRDFINGVVDFAGSDAVMTEQQNADLARQRGGVTALYFPTLLGAVSVPVNLPGLTGNRIKLDGKTIGDIFSGAITTWNSGQITRQNPGIRFPASPITVCVRSDGSGTSFNFSRYLTKVSPNFRTKVNYSQTPPWTAPNLIKQPGNAGVANCVKSNTNAIGYVDLGDAINAGLQTQVVAVGHSRVIRGRRVMQYVLPSTKSISLAGNLTAAQIARPTPKLALDLTGSPAAGAYPIAITTWILAYSSYQQAGRAGSLADVKSFLNFAYTPAAQNVLPSLGFAPLPTPILAASKAQLARLTS